MTSQPNLLLKKEYPASLEGVLEFLGELEVLGSQQNWSLADQNHWALIGEEIATNIVKYAYPESDANQRFWVSLHQQDNRITTEFQDQGQPFDPLQEKATDTQQDIEDMPIGGLGIMLVKKIADHLEYQRTDGKNLLRIEKQLNSRQIDQ